MNQFTNESIIEKLPEDHFGNFTNEVIALLLSGQCCVVYGIHGYGMDFFAKHVSLVLNNQHPEVNQIYINLELETDKISIIKQKLCKLAKTKDFDESALTEFFKNNKLVLIMAKVITPEHKELFKFVSELRETFYGNFVVLSVGDYSLFKMTNAYSRYGKTLFSPLRRIPNFDLLGVKRIIYINNNEYNWSIPESVSNQIFKLSGGNPALVKYICMAIYEEGNEILEMPDRLIEFQPLNYRLEEITTLFTELSIAEQIKIGLLSHDGKIFSELLELYLRLNKFEALDILFPNLTPTEKRLLALFIKNPNKIINKDQISIVLKQTLDSYSEWAIYKMVARLRDKIGSSYQIETLKGQGWRLKS